MKKGIWAGIFLAMLGIAAGLYFFWEEIVLIVAPKAVLTTSLTKLVDQLEERFEGDPLWVLLDLVDPDGRYTADVNFRTENELLGSVDYDLNVKTDFQAHRLYASGTATMAQRELDLSLYLDKDKMAVSSDGLVDGQYYGITYESFREDIYSIPLLKWMVSDKVLTNWENSIRNIQNAMQQEIRIPQIPDLEHSEIKKLLFGVLTMPCHIEKTTFWLDGEVVTCHKMDYVLAGEEVGKIIASFTNQNFGGDTSATVSFYLYEKSVICMKIRCNSGVERFDAEMNLGLNPVEEPIDVVVSRNGEQLDSYFSANVNTLRTDNLYSARWEVQNTNLGNTVSFSCDYAWNPDNGEMELRLNDASERVVFIFRKQEDDVYIKTDDVAKALGMFTSKNSRILSDNISCTMVISDGSAISEPEYKNLNKWSINDFLGLMSGVGALIGLNIG